MDLPIFVVSYCEFYEGGSVQYVGTDYIVAKKVLTNAYVKDNGLYSRLEVWDGGKLFETEYFNLSKDDK